MNRPPIPEPPHKGGCLCGAVRYTYDAHPLALNACHCTDCKKLSGCGFTAVLIGKRDALSHSGETARWRKRGASGREIDIVRCAECGARLWHEPVQALNLVFIQSGTLDDPSWFLPTGHIWVEHASRYAHFAPDALKIEGQPADRQILFDAFDRVYPP